MLEHHTQARITGVQAEHRQDDHDTLERNEEPLFSDQRSVIPVAKLVNTVGAADEDEEDSRDQEEDEEFERAGEFGFFGGCVEFVGGC